MNEDYLEYKFAEEIESEIEPHIKTIIEASIDIYIKTQKETTVKGKLINILADRLKYDAIDILRILNDD